MLKVKSPLILDAILGSQNGNTTQMHQNAQQHLIIPAICKKCQSSIHTVTSCSSQLTRYGYCNDYGRMSTPVILSNLPMDMRDPCPLLSFDIYCWIGSSEIDNNFTSVLWSMISKHDYTKEWDDINQIENRRGSGAPKTYHSWKILHAQNRKMRNIIKKKL